MATKVDASRSEAQSSGLEQWLARQPKLANRAPVPHKTSPGNLAQLG